MPHTLVAALGERFIRGKGELRVDVGVEKVGEALALESVAVRVKVEFQHP